MKPLIRRVSLAWNADHGSPWRWEIVFCGIRVNSYFTFRGACQYCAKLSQ